MTAVWLLIVLGSIAYIKYNLTIVSDLKQFMPSSSDDKQLRILLHETQSGSTSNIILAQISGASPEYLAKFSKNLKSSLESHYELFEFVNNGDQDINIKSFQSLIDYRYLLRHPDDFSSKSLRYAFEELLIAFRSGASGDTIKYLLSDPQQSFMKYISVQAGLSQPEKYNDVWFVEDKSRALLMIKLKAVGFDLDAQQKGINAIKVSVKALDDSDKVNLVLSGPGVIAVSTRDSIRSTTQYVGWVLTGLVIFLFWFGYRSLRLAFIAGIPLITSIIVTIAITQMIFGELHGIVLAFGITMLGVCLDYPLHLFSHLNKYESSVSTLKRIWPTLQLGAITSIFAYVGLIGTGFSGLTQLAVFSATGLIVALSVTRWLIPVWVSADWIDKRAVWVFLPLSDRRKIILSIVVVMMPLYFLLTQDSIWSDDISQISPISSSIAETDRQLRQALFAPDVTHMFLIEAETSNRALVKTEELKLLIMPAIEKGIISGMQMATDILPSQDKQKKFQLFLPDNITLKKRVAEAADGLGFKNNAFNNFINAVAVSKSRPTIEYEEILASPLGTELQSMLFERDGRWYSIIRLSGIKSESEFNKWLNASSGIKQNYISIHGATNTLMTQYLDNAWGRLLVIMSLVVGIILWQVRNRRESIWLLVPVISGVVMSLAVQVALGNFINIFHVLSLLLVIGMGLDYSLFFNRDWKCEDQLSDRTHAIIISAITTIVAFSVLGFSDIPILAAMGQTVSIGILTCFIVAHRVAIPKQNPEVR